jgi:hypothetical protein
MQRNRSWGARLVVFAAGLGLFWLSTAVASAEPARSGDADPRFERLKGLVGTWVGTAQHGEQSFPTQVTYRLTGGGSAVMEILFEGTEHEMTTVYHRDGADLVLTHYCAAGNQPHMRATAADDAAVLRFEFAGGTNLDPAKDMHMHEGVIRWLDADHVQTAWASYQDGKPVGEARFDLTRKK